MKWKGTHQEICSFASGLVLQCPRVSDEKKNIKEMLAELFVIFGITHVLVIDNPDLSSFISRNCPDIIKEVAPKLEGIDNLSKLPKSTKIKNYFGEHKVVTEKLSFEEAIVYEIIEEEHRSPYVRTVDIRTELVNKTGVAILEAESKRCSIQEGRQEKNLSKSPNASCSQWHYRPSGFLG